MPVNKWVLEAPAERVEAGELIKVASVCTAPGYSDEVHHIFLARKPRFVGASPEPSELIKAVES